MKNYLNLFNIKNLPNIEKTFWQGFKYTFITCVLFVFSVFVFIFSSIYMAGLIPNEANVEKISSAILSQYPEGLVLNFSKEGIFSKNIPGVIYFGSMDDGKKIVAIDDSSSVSLENLEKSAALVFVGKDGIITKKENGKTEIFSFSEMVKGAEEAGSLEGFSLDKNKIINIKDKIKSDILPIFIVSVFAVLIIILIFAPIIFSLVHIAWTVAVALIVMFVFYIGNSKKTFEESYNLSLYAGVPAIVIGSLLSFVLDFLFIQTTLTILFVVISYFLLNKNTMVKNI